MPPTANASPPKSTQLPFQSMPNPNKKPQQQQQVYSANFSVSDIHLQLGTTLPTPSPPFITQLPSEEITQDTILDQPTNPKQVPQSETLGTPIRTP